MGNIKEYETKIFEQIKHIDENGAEYWLARELMEVLEYTKWENFHKTIKRAMVACELSQNSIRDHFPEVRKMIEIAKGAKRNVLDYKLSRYACYLIVQNGDSSKKVIALGQTYFAVQTRKMELTEEEYLNLPEDMKRLYTRIEVGVKNRKLFYVARECGVTNFGKFNNYGYRGLYNEETAEDIRKRKGLDDKEEILDWMGNQELGANLFRITQTEGLLEKNQVNSESDACNTHYKVGRAVRNTIKELGGTMPEELPTPKVSTKEIEKEYFKKLMEKA